MSERVIRDYEGRVFLLEKRGVSIQIVNLSSTNTVVTMKNAPFEVTNEVESFLNEKVQDFVASLYVMF